MFDHCSCTITPSVCIMANVDMTSVDYLHVVHYIHIESQLQPLIINYCLTHSHTNVRGWMYMVW